MLLKTTDVVDNLTSDANDVPLSAKQGKLLKTDVDKKADKVTGATADNFASLDTNGNLKDSGKKASDFETADNTILKKANVVNDLTTGGIDVPLSAEQGKVINVLITSMMSDLFAIIDANVSFITDNMNNLIVSNDGTAILIN